MNEFSFCGSCVYCVPRNTVTAPMYYCPKWNSFVNLTTMPCDLYLRKEENENEHEDLLD
jgi:hypothetical protein